MLHFSELPQISPALGAVLLPECFDQVRQSPPKSGTLGGNGKGNVSEYVNQSGVEVAHFEYDPFGNLTVAAASNAGSFPWRFSTKPQDPVTGLYYYGYRYYNPVMGKWPSRDPSGDLVFSLNYVKEISKDLNKIKPKKKGRKLEEELDGNLYGLLKNNSVNNVDLLGLMTLNSISRLLSYIRCCSRLECKINCRVDRGAGTLGCIAFNELSGGAATELQDYWDRIDDVYCACMRYCDKRLLP